VIDVMIGEILAQRRTQNARLTCAGVCRALQSKEGSAWTNQQSKLQVLLVNTAQMTRSALVTLSVTDSDATVRRVIQIYMTNV